MQEKRYKLPSVRILHSRCSAAFAMLMVAWASAFAMAQETQLPAKPGEIVAQLAQDVAEAETVVSNGWVVDWMKQIGKLPPIESRMVESNGKSITVDEGLFYSSRYGSPLSYARALDLAVTAGFEGHANSRVFDFGYGSIGHLRMLALAGHHAVGVDVAPLLKQMYADANGPLEQGSVQVLHGRFPQEEELVRQVGGDFDLVISKNVLKKGYIHPSRSVADSRMLIDLGVADEVFLSRIAQMLKPEGLFVIYNFCPPKKPANEPYIPWSEGESPFTKDAFAAAGFEVLSFDVVDDAEARRLGHALGWDAPGGMNLQSDLFAWYTIARKLPTESVGVQP